MVTFIFSYERGLQLTQILQRNFVKLFSIAVGYFVLPLRRHLMHLNAFEKIVAIDSTNEVRDCTYPSVTKLRTMI